MLHWWQAEAEAELGLNPRVDEKELLRDLARLPLRLGALGPNGLVPLGTPWPVSRASSSRLISRTKAAGS